MTHKLVPVCLDPEILTASSLHLPQGRFYLPITGINCHEHLLCACSTTTCDRQRASRQRIATSNSASAQLTDNSIRDSTACLFVRSRTTQPTFHTCFLFSLLFRRAFLHPHSHTHTFELTCANCRRLDWAWLLVRVNADHVQGTLMTHKLSGD